LPAHVEEFQGYRITIYSPSGHFAVITPPGSNAVMQLGNRRPESTVVEGKLACLDRARALIVTMKSE